MNGTVYNLGCGRDIHPDACNVDFRYGPGVQLIANLSVFPWPFADQEAVELRMFDFLEHFPRSETRKILLECYRVLVPGGSLVVQVPDMEILGRAMCGGKVGGFPCNVCGFEFDEERVDMVYGECPQCHAEWPEIVDAAFGRTYGGQDYPGNFHMAGFSRESLSDKLVDNGFTDIEFLEFDHQRKNWNFKIRAKKGGIWK